MKVICIGTTVNSRTKCFFPRFYPVQWKWQCKLKIRSKMMMMNTEVLQVVHEKEHWIDESPIPPLPRGREESWPNIQEEVSIIVDKKSRRKSWHAIKFERKRRKGVVDPSTPPESRQKRPSWWNIFASSQWPRYLFDQQCLGWFCSMILWLFKLFSAWLYYRKLIHISLDFWCLVLNFIATIFNLIESCMLYYTDNKDKKFSSEFLLTFLIRSPEF